MAPDIFPRYRHVVVKAGNKFPSRVLRETYDCFETRFGTFCKNSRRMLGHPSITFEGPFTADGDMEGRP